MGNKLFLYTQKTGTPVLVPPPAVVKALEKLEKLESEGKYFFPSGREAGDARREAGSRSRRSPGAEHRRRF
jgi:hypothetical protein